jgi:hypothetical protein
LFAVCLLVPETIAPGADTARLLAVGPPLGRETHSLKIIQEITVVCDYQHKLPRQRRAGRSYHFPYLLESFTPANTVALKEKNKLLLCDEEGNAHRFGTKVIGITVVPRGNLHDIQRFYQIFAEVDPRQPNQVEIFALAVAWYPQNRSESEPAALIVDVLVHYIE